MKTILFTLILLILFGSSADAQNQDCATATPVCATSVFSGNANGSGTQDLNGGNAGCLLGLEHQSSWYQITVVNNGVLQFLIDPTTVTDYDFALYGPNVTCGALGAPLRCSWATAGTTNPCGASLSNATGLVPCIAQTSEGSFGDGYVSTVNITAGETYYLIVDNYSSNTQPFTIDFTGSTAGSLGCVSLPIDGLTINGRAHDGKNVIEWQNVNENCVRYFVESVGPDSEIVMLDSIGCINALNENSYVYVDEHPAYRSMYRVRLVDHDGMSIYSEFIEIIRDRVVYSNLLNPSVGEGIFMIDDEWYGKTYEVIDVTGRVVRTGEIEDGILDLREIHVGYYTVRIDNFFDRILIHR